MVDIVDIATTVLQTDKGRDDSGDVRTPQLAQFIITLDFETRVHLHTPDSREVIALGAQDVHIRVGDPAHVRSAPIEGAGHRDQRKSVARIDHPSIALQCGPIEGPHGLSPLVRRVAHVDALRSKLQRAQKQIVEQTLRALVGRRLAGAHDPVDIGQSIRTRLVFVDGKRVADVRTDIGTHGQHRDRADFGLRDSVPHLLGNGVTRLGNHQPALHIDDLARRKLID